MLEPLLGRERLEGWLGHAVDVTAVVGTLFGVATSLGLGVQQILAGLVALGLGLRFALPSGSFALVGWGLAILGAALALLLAMWKRMKPKELFEVVLSVGRTSAPLLILLFCAQLYSRVLSMTGITGIGQPCEQGSGYHAIHLLTPENAHSTHYFFTAIRFGVRTEDEAFNRSMQTKVAAMRRFAFEDQDAPVIAALAISSCTASKELCGSLLLA